MFYDFVTSTHDLQRKLLRQYFFLLRSHDFFNAFVRFIITNRFISPTWADTAILQINIQFLLFETFVREN